MLVVAGDGWHRGVIGIVASKLVDAYRKPALVLSVDGRHRARIGPQHSGVRPARGARVLCTTCSCKFGGHKQAAGVTIEAARIPELRRRLTACANERLSPEDLVPRLRIDAPLGLREISGEVIEGLHAARPVRRGQSQARVPGVAGRSGRRRRDD